MRRARTRGRLAADWSPVIAECKHNSRRYLTEFCCVLLASRAQMPASNVFGNILHARLFALPSGPRHRPQTVRSRSGRVRRLLERQLAHTLAAVLFVRTTLRKRARARRNMEVQFRASRRYRTFRCPPASSTDGVETELLRGWMAGARSMTVEQGRHRFPFRPRRSSNCSNDGQRLVLVDNEAGWPERAGWASEIDIASGAVTRKLATYQKEPRPVLIRLLS